MAAKSKRGVRVLSTAFVLFFAGLLFSGVVMMFTREPDRGATRAMNAGARSSPGADVGQQALHEGLSSLMTILAIAGGAWLMVKVAEDWSGWIGAMTGTVVVAAVSGLLIRYEAIAIDGVFVEELRGYSFVLDAGFEQAAYGNRIYSSGTYRVLFGIHLVASALTIACGVFGIRAIGRPRVERPLKRSPA